MGRRKFEDGDYCKLDKTSAPEHLVDQFGDSVLQVVGYYRPSYRGTNKYEVQPLDGGKEDKIRPSYLKSYNGTVSSQEDDRLDARLKVTENRIETLESQKRTLKAERKRVQERIRFREEWGLDEFDEDLWCASKIHDIIGANGRSREEKVRSISSIIQACKA